MGSRADSSLNQISRLPWILVQMKLASDSSDCSTTAARFDRHSPSWRENLDLERSLTSGEAIDRIPNALKSGAIGHPQARRVERLLLLLAGKRSQAD